MCHKSSSQIGPHHKIKYVSQANVVPQSFNNVNLCELHDPQIGELAHIGSGVGTDLPNVKFAIPAFEMCAFDAQFSTQVTFGLLWTEISLFAVSLPGQACVVVCHAPWYLW
jgi:hypothetical protein